eukprot:jgi/Tetstr1/423489/TSEL_014167.t1
MRLRSPPAAPLPLLLLIFFCGVSASRTLEKSQKQPGSPGRLLVALSKGGADRAVGNSHSLNSLSASLASAASVTKVRVLPNLGVALVDANSFALATASLSSNPTVKSVSVDLKVHIAGVPNDPQYSTLWGMDKIEAPAAWDITTGSSEVVVCVIDTGVDYLHPDLVRNMWINTGEIPGDGIDNDGNGYIDDVHGIDATDSSGDPMDDHMHGTHCAGTVGAKGGNGIGVVGVAPTVSIMACKFLSAEGDGVLSDALTCLEYAVANGAHISSNSWGGGGFDPVMETALTNAGLAGHLFIAAAGNSARDNDGAPSYPASYQPTYDAVISVASVADNDVLSEFSQWGATSVDLAAPGSDINSCAASVIGGGYTSISGTSMATPHVSGAAALMLANNPDLTNLEIKRMLIETCTVSPALRGMVVSNGILNARAALTGETPDPIVMPDPTLVETFSGDFDLSQSSITFTGPDYTPCKGSRVEIDSDGTELKLADDANVAVDFTGGFTFTFYEQTYDKVYVGSNGFLTFGEGDSTWQTSLGNHNRLPRISPLYTDLSPDSASTISYEQAPDMFVVTYENIKRYGHDSQRSTFQVALHSDGAVTISYGEVANDAAVIVGLGNGGYSRPTDFSESSLCLATFPEVPTPAWEMFWRTSPFDLAGTTLTFSQHDNYRPCRTPWTSDGFPHEPLSAQRLQLADDDSRLVAFTGGFVFPLWADFTGVYVGSNGYLTFTGPDTQHAASAKNHHTQPRVSALYTDLVADADSVVTYEQLPAAFVATYQNVAEYGHEDSRSSFQIKLMGDGTVSITYLNVEAHGPVLVGLSNGDAGASLAVDFTAFGECSAEVVCPSITPLQARGALGRTTAACPSTGQSMACTDGGRFRVRRQGNDLIATCTTP